MLHYILHCNSVVLICQYCLNSSIGYAEKSGAAVMAEPDRCLYLVFQVVRVWCLRGNEGIKCELCAEAETGDEAIEGRLSVNRCPGIGILDKAPLFFTG